MFIFQVYLRSCLSSLRLTVDSVEAKDHFSFNSLREPRVDKPAPQENQINHIWQYGAPITKANHKSYVVIGVIKDLVRPYTLTLPETNIEFTAWKSMRLEDDFPLGCVPGQFSDANLPAVSGRNYPKFSQTYPNKTSHLLLIWNGIPSQIK